MLVNSEECKELRRLSEIMRGGTDVVNEYRLSETESGFPCLAVLIKGDIAAVTYFPDDGHAGYTAAGSGDFREFADFGMYEIHGDMVISADKAASLAEEFFLTGKKPCGTEWTEL